MKDVDAPPGRVDKAMDEILKTKTRFQHYRPQPCPHFTHIRQFNHKFTNTFETEAEIVPFILQSLHGKK